jgi:hypothetical protein
MVDKKKAIFCQEKCLPKSASKKTESNRIPKCLQKIRKQQIPYVPPKEQEVTQSSLLKPMNAPSLA